MNKQHNIIFNISQCGIALSLNDTNDAAFRQHNFANKRFGIAFVLGMMSNNAVSTYVSISDTQASAPQLPLRGTYNMTTNTTTASLLVQGTTRNQARQADMENSDVRYLAPTTSLNSEDDVASFGRRRERIREREKIKKLLLKITGRWRFSNTWNESVLQSEFVHKVYSSKLHLLTSVSAKECSEPLIRGHCCWGSSLCISQLYTEEEWETRNGVFI